MQFTKGSKLIIALKFKANIKWWCEGYCPGDGTVLESCPEGFEKDHDLSIAINDLDITDKELNKLQDLGERAWKARKAAEPNDWTDGEWKWFMDFIKTNCSTKLKLAMDKVQSDFEKTMIKALILKEFCKCDEDEIRRQKFTFMLDDYLAEIPSKRAFSL